MPTYVYKFIKSGETIEVQQAFTDDALTEVAHPKTGRKMSVKKVFLPVGVSFKGGGFYKTDSRDGSSASSSSSGASASESTGDSNSSSSSDTASSNSNGSTTDTSKSSSTPAPTSTSSETSAKTKDTGSATASNKPARSSKPSSD